MRRLHSLDAFRTLAMIWIFLNHCVFLTLNEVTKDVWDNWMHFGGVGVEFFIIVSGFMAAYCYRCDKDLHTATFNYVKKKMLRLYPIHWCCLLLYFPLCVFVEKTETMKLIVSCFASVTLTQTLVPNLWECINAASWTIGTLFILYIFVPLVNSKLRNISKSLITSLIVGGG